MPIKEIKHGLENFGLSSMQLRRDGDRQRREAETPEEIKETGQKAEEGIGNAG